MTCFQLFSSFISFTITDKLPSSYSLDKVEFHPFVASNKPTPWSNALVPVAWHGLHVGSMVKTRVEWVENPESQLRESKWRRTSTTKLTTHEVDEVACQTTSQICMGRCRNMVSGWQARETILLGYLDEGNARGPKGVGGRVGVWDTNPDYLLLYQPKILGVPLSNNPFHKGIPGIQTTNPNHQLTIS